MCPRGWTASESSPLPTPPWPGTRPRGPRHTRSRPFWTALTSYSTSKPSRSLRFVPESFEGVETGGGHVDAAPAGRVLHDAIARRELRRRPPQRGLGVDAQVARPVDD